MKEKFLFDFNILQSEKLRKSNSKSLKTNSMVLSKQSPPIPMKNPEILKVEYETRQKIYTNQGFTANIDQFLKKIVQDKRGSLLFII